MKRLIAFFSLWFAACSFAAGSWNGVAVTAWNGVAFTAWNGTSISAAGGGGGGSLAFTHLVMTGSTSNVASYASGSFTPTSNALVLVTVANTKASAADTPTLTGNGLTYVQIASTTWDASTAKRITIFRGMGASPTAGAVTADFAGASQTGCNICAVQFTGADTGGTNGSAAIVQSATNSANGTTSVNVTLAALTGSTNGVYMAGGNRSVPFGGTPDSGWTENQDTSHASPNHGFSDIYSTATTDNTPSTVIASDNWGAVAVEIKKAP